MTTRTTTVQRGKRMVQPAPTSRRRGPLARLPRTGPWTGDAIALALVVLVLVVIGLIMSFSASFVDGAEEGNAFGIFNRQLLWAAIGVPAYFAVAAVAPRVWRPLSWILLAVSIVGLMAVLVPGIGLAEFGSRRWIAIGPVVWQPSEGAKLALLLWLADVHARKREQDIATEERVDHLLIPALPVLGLLAILVMAEPDLGTTIILSTIVAIVLWADGIPVRTAAALGGAGLVLVAAAAVLEPYRFARISGWLDPEGDPLGNGYQLTQSLYAMGDGRWFGVGLGSSRGKWNFIPNPETDFIYAIIGEELGIVGALFVLALFAVLLVVGTRVARRAEGHFARLVALTVTVVTVTQALVNIGAVTGLLPITGVTLPLISVGGSSLVSKLVALGILTAIARETPAPAPVRTAPRAPLRAVDRGGRRR